jgi:hypothetical protein
MPARLYNLQTCTSIRVFALVLPPYRLRPGSLSFGRAMASPADQPPLKLRRSAEASAKAEALGKAEASAKAEGGSHKGRGRWS